MVLGCTEGQKISSMAEDEVRQVLLVCLVLNYLFCASFFVDLRPTNPRKAGPPSSSPPTKEV